MFYFCSNVKSRTCSPCTFTASTSVEVVFTHTNASTDYIYNHVLPRKKQGCCLCTKAPKLAEKAGVLLMH